ncbi:Signal Recognition Particle (SRP) component with 4.5S RNA (ffs) [Candidatus Promineifilum breve]|uniref:Signal recognition particle protein n=1 Tax=Candidatus Promineifilum breve TaxID=1806508 RepID=A0A160SXY0_9CHLR|nr:signal recognition particle protein [Candidatus Promineifilum breve]CUS02241.2 Signal Recognition Particle (SRP) component with 4.5S RNA (ffs) [Candidatus Promineifilum breve]
MFETLGSRLQSVFDNLQKRGKLTEADVDVAMREVRLALLEADVNFKVVKEFVARVRERAVGQEVMRSLTPGQQVVKIVHDELVRTLGEPGRLNLGAQSPAVIMLVGLQGAGKTTMAGKLALHLRKQGRRPFLVAADIYRPAAINQLETLGKQLDIPVYSEGTNANPVTVCANGIKQAAASGATTVILDTAGRLNIDEMMMGEIKNIKARVQPIETLLVADAMTGQEAVRVATDFHQAVTLTGLIMTKIDGDARGGAAISMREVTGVPIKFLGTGEKLNAIEVFHPDRLANRILGMGDVMTLIEQAQSEMDMEEAQRAGQKLVSGDFDLDDFLKQLQQVKKMGPIGKLLEMVPGMNKMTADVDLSSAEKDLKRIEAMIQSMTTDERRNPKMIKASRKRRIAVGSGTSVQEINVLLKQHREMQEMMKQFQKGGRGRNALSSLLGGRM